ncbi:MAG: alpha/beta hydrolase [Candidatus Omnitrophica bacterium]|nr:alpha/beta hydrolase [Candidatus Omnitrophota bacterium]
MKSKIISIKDRLIVGRFLVPYRIYENNGPHIICINGVQQSMAMWHSFVSRFSHDYRIVIFDFPNQGKGKVISGPAKVTLEEQVQILAAVMDKAGVSTDVTMCAASWGGVVAVVFASRRQNRIKRLILASLGTKPNKKMAETIKRGAAVSMNDRDMMAKVLIESFGENLPEQFKQKIVTQFSSMKEEDVRAFYEHGLFVLSSKQLTDLVSLKDIKVKTILINGEKDTIIDLEDARFLASQIPNCELKVIKGVGHFLHMEREDVLDTYEEILSS